MTQKLYTNGEALRNDPSVIALAKALRNLSKEIAFTELTVKHIISTVNVVSMPTQKKFSVAHEDYFSLNITQGDEKSKYHLVDVDLIERPPIYLSKCEYDLLATNDQKEGRKLGDFKTYHNMKEAGWFKDVSLDMKITDILKECIVENK